MSELQELKSALKLSITKKKNNQRVASVAYSLSGKKYKAGMVESDTNFFAIPSEQLALAFSAQNNDFKVNKVITIIESPKKSEIVSPTTARILIDHSIRTGFDIEYKIIDIKGKTLFKIKKVRDFFPNLYNPENKILEKTKSVKVSSNKIKIKKGDDLEKILKECAVKGIVRNFPTYDSASGYGTAVLTKDGYIYFGGQYSSFEKRTVHSEIAVVLRVLMDKKKITHLGLASSKYKDEPCNMCGGCRQFVSEIISFYGMDIEIILFSKDIDTKNKIKINEYLPHQWTSKRWQNINSH